jgi:pimeloyl-ACP methyl ester carboxylesterase
MPPEDAWTRIGGEGDPLVFTHANGFPPETYRRLLDGLLPRFQVSAFANRSLWSDADPSSVTSWHQLADDIRTAVAERFDGPVLGVGHSIGGMTCALAAASAPEIFSRLVLLDPVVFSGPHAFFWGWMKRLGLGSRFPLVAGAERRRESWPDRETHRASWERKRVFASWDPRAFEDYLESGVCERPDGSVALRYPRVWEAQLFRVCPHNEWSHLRRIAIPVLVIRGETSDTLFPAAARRIERELPDARVVELEGTSHFLPMEKPDAVAELIVEFAAGA